jgi:hypothetical protein
MEICIEDRENRIRDESELRPYVFSCSRMVFLFIPADVHIMPDGNAALRRDATGLRPFCAGRHVASTT